MPWGRRGVLANASAPVIILEKDSQDQELEELPPLIAARRESVGSFLEVKEASKKPTKSLA